MSQQDPDIKSTIYKLYHDFNQKFLSPKFQKHANRQLLNGIQQQIVIQSKQEFLTNIIENMQNVPNKNKNIIYQLDKKEKGFSQSFNNINNKKKDEYETNILNEKYTQQSAVRLVQQLLGQSNNALGYKNLLNQNKKHKQQLINRQQIIERLQTEIKEAQNTQTKLKKQIQNFNQIMKQKQTQITKLSKKVIQKGKQNLKLQQKQEEEIKVNEIDQQCNAKIKIYQNDKDILRFQMEQNKTQIQGLNDQLKELLQNQAFLNKRVQYLKQQNQLLRSIIDQIRFKNQAKANTQTNDIEILYQNRVIKQLEINIHLVKQQTKQQIMKYQKTIEENDKKYYQSINQLKIKNQTLQGKYQILLKDKSQCQKLIIDMKNKYQYNYKQMNNKHHKEIQKLKQQLSVKQQCYLKYEKSLKEIAQLKFQEYLKISQKILKQSKNNVRALSINAFNNFYDSLQILKKQVKELKKQNICLKNSFINQLRMMYRIFQKIIYDLFVKIRQQNKFDCKMCSNINKSQDNKKTKNKLNFEKCDKVLFLSPKTQLNPNISNVPLIGSFCPNIHSKSKRNLLESVKKLAKKYESIQQQNRFFVNQIQKIYNK